MMMMPLLIAFSRPISQLLLRISTMQSLDSWATTIFHLFLYYDFSTSSDAFVSSINTLHNNCTKEAHQALTILYSFMKRIHIASCTSICTHEHVHTYSHAFNDVTDIIDSQIDVKYVSCFVMLGSFFSCLMIFMMFVVNCFGFWFHYIETGQFGERKGTEQIMVRNHWPLLDYGLWTLCVWIIDETDSVFLIFFIPPNSTKGGYDNVSLVVVFFLSSSLFFFRQYNLIHEEILRAIESEPKVYESWFINLKTTSITYISY